MNQYHLTIVFLLLSNNCGLVSSPNNYGFVSSPNNCNLVSTPNNCGLVSSPQKLVSLHDNGSYTVLFSNNYNSYSLWIHIKKIVFNMGTYEKKKTIGFVVDAYENKSLSHGRSIKRTTTTIMHGEGAHNK